jgi:transcriptional regulator with XRE-family HTH domain
MNKIGQTIRIIRQSRGLSQKEVAHKLELSVAAFSKIETGFSKLSLDRLNQVSALFNIPVPDLLAGKTTESIEIVEDEVDFLKKKLAAREEEIMELQKKVIELFEELRIGYTMQLNHNQQ